MKQSDIIPFFEQEKWDFCFGGKESLRESEAVQQMKGNEQFVFVLRQRAKSRPESSTRKSYVKCQGPVAQKAIYKF